MSDYIIGAVVGAVVSITVTLLARIFDRKLTAAQATSNESQSLLNLQQVADRAIAEQDRLQKQIDRLEAIKKVDYDLHVIFSLGPPPEVKKATLKAIPPD